MPRTPPPAAKVSRTPARNTRPGSSGRARAAPETADAGKVYSQPAPLAPVPRTPSRGSDGRKTRSPLPAQPRDFLNRRPSTASPCPDDDEGPGARTLIGRLRSLGENKIYGMQSLCNKVALALALNFVAELFEDLMPWWPTTFILPRDMREATSAMHRKDKTGKPIHTFIFKPDSTFGGNGVCLVQAGDVLHSLMQRKYSTAVLQEYLTRPLLIDGLKWDCRVYVLVTSISPLRVYVAREGLARFCTELYRRPNAENLEAMFSHVTNYALNKQSPTYQESDGDPTGGLGSKRALSVVLKRLEKLSRTFTVEQFWAEVDHIVAMTLLVLQPELIHKANVRKNDSESDNNGGAPSFHLLGFDILLDSNERASLLELNANPSVSTQSGGYNPITGRLEISTCAVDEAVKTAVVDGVCSIVEQETADDSTATIPSAAPFHRLDVWQQPEYLRVRQLLQRLGRLLQYSLRSETAVGERDTGLGCARFCRFVKDAGLLTVRAERLKGGSIGTVVPALTPNIVESMFKSVITSGGKTAVKSQLEYTKLGLLLRELARHQLSPQHRRAIMPQQPAVDLLEKTTKKLELLLGTTADVSAAPAASADAAADKSAANEPSEDSIEQAAQAATSTLGRMNQLVQELEKRRAPRRDQAHPPIAQEATGLLPSPSRAGSQDNRRPLPRAREQRSKVSTASAALDSAPGVAVPPTDGSTKQLRLPRTPPSRAPRTGAGGHDHRTTDSSQASSSSILDSRVGQRRQTAARRDGAAIGESNSPPLGPHEAGARSPHMQLSSKRRAERRRQQRDDVLAKQIREAQQGKQQQVKQQLGGYSKAEGYRFTAKPQIKMQRMTWAVPELDSLPVRRSTYTHVSRPLFATPFHCNR